jgi:Uma2 family endonuclease
MATVSQTVAKWTPPTDKPDALYEFVDGEWKEVPRMGAFASLLASSLAQELNEFAQKNGLGLAMCEVLFRFAPEGPARRPDVAYVAFDVVPNLAVEVVSPTNGYDEILGKVRDYFFHGVQLVWVISPRLRLVQVHESPEHSRVLTAQQELEGGSILPGFHLPLSSFFATGVRPV